MTCFGAGMMLIPLGFVGGCCYVVYISPVNMQKTDAKFFHAFAFLFFWFKPDAYWFTVFFLLRNLLVALGPTLLELLFQVGVLVVLGGLRRYLRFVHLCPLLLLLLGCGCC